jgi:hypothetical protein
VTTALVATGAILDQVRGAQHEETTYRIRVARLTMGKSSVVSSKDLVPAGMVECKTIGMRLMQLSSGPRLGRHIRIL